MKKSLMLMLSLALVLLGATAAVALDAPKVTVGAGYLFGDASLDNGSTLNFADKGLMLNADAKVVGPFGVMLSYITLTGSAFESGGMEVPDGLGVSDKSTRTDLLVTYAPSFGKGGLKLFAGYSTTVEKLKPPVLIAIPEYTTTVKGHLVGAALTLPLGEKLVLSGLGGYGVAMEWDQARNGVALDDGDANLLTYRLAATYLVHPSFALEAGYIGNNYTLKTDADDITEKVSGFFAGARALF